MTSLLVKPRRSRVNLGAVHPAAWQKAVDSGANGKQTNLPVEFVAFLRADNTAAH
jgi:hypothetical protein